MNCTDCQKHIEEGQQFPQGRCLDCHAIEFDKHPMPTAQEIRQMWGMR